MNRQEALSILDGEVSLLGSIARSDRWTEAIKLAMALMKAQEDALRVDQGKELFRQWWGTVGSNQIAHTSTVGAAEYAFMEGYAQRPQSEDVTEATHLQEAFKAWYKYERSSPEDVIAMLTTANLAAYAFQAGYRERPKWVCYHCGFATNDATEAHGHFGEDPDVRPLCLDWNDLSADEKLKEYQNMAGELGKQREENAEMRGEDKVPRLLERLGDLEREESRKYDGQVLYLLTLCTDGSGHIERQCVHGHLVEVAKWSKGLEIPGILAVVERLLSLHSTSPFDKPPVQSTKEAIN